MAKAKIKEDVKFKNDGGVTIRLVGHGHNMTIDPGETKGVPDALHGEALRQGAKALDSKQVVTKSDVEITKAVEETDPAMRASTIEDVIRAMAAENDSQEWGANGKPLLKVVIEKVGYKVNGGEVAAAWKKISAEV